MVAAESVLETQTLIRFGTVLFSEVQVEWDFFFPLCNTGCIVCALGYKNGLHFIHVLFNKAAAGIINLSFFFFSFFRLHIFPDSPEK